MGLGRKGGRNPKKAPTHARNPEKKGERRNVEEKRKNTRNVEIQIVPGSYEINTVKCKGDRSRKTVPLCWEYRKARTFGGKKNARVIEIAGTMNSAENTKSDGTVP